MKIIIENIQKNPADILRQIGYQFQHHTEKEMSFVRPLARGGYPRFHIYASLQNNNLILNIHLDQKRHTYGHSTRHHGEYDDEGTLQEEAKRIQSYLNSQI